MKVEPRILGVVECLWFSRARLVVCQLAGNYIPMSFGEENSVDVVVVRVFCFLLNGLDCIVCVALPVIRSLHEFLSLEALDKLIRSKS
jgi:hypothetical protein